MNQEIIQDFWNLPGVLGVALIYGQAEPYFYVKERIVAWEKQALIQMILQTIARIPEKSEFVEFQVIGYYAYTYKLNSKLTLVVLTPNDIVAVKLLAANQLKAALQEDMGEAIKTFELLTKKARQPRTVLTAKSRTPPPQNNNSSITPLEAKVTVEELLSALNHLSVFSSNYMGAKLTANYWQSARPSFEWLDNFQINHHSAEIIFSGVITESVSASQHQWVKKWTAAFIKRCSQIVQDMPTMIEQKGLDEPKKKLLLTPAS